jgi:sensor histidine kinase YesM
MNKRANQYLSRFTTLTIVGLAFAFGLGYVAKKFDWGFGYLVATGLVLGCAYGVEIISSLSAVYLFPRFEKYPRGRQLTLQLASSILVHVLAWILLIWIASRFMGFNIFQWKVMIWLVLFVIVLVVASSVRQVLRFYRELKQKDVVEEKLKALAAQAELKALKAQINPHFLFNSLNTIASLTTSAPAKAEEAVEKLADVFRYVLSSSNREFVTLENEIDFLDSYLDIEKTRFGDKLNVSKSIQAEVLNTRVPSLILQPLVENCLKYGTSEGKVKIEIKCFLNNNAVNIEIRDEGKGVPQEIKNGVYTKGTGLKNVNERLLKVYGEGHGLQFKDNQPNGAVAMLTIPREKT